MLRYIVLRIVDTACDSFVVYIEIIRDCLNIFAMCVMVLLRNT